jgi:hypothetical protein
MGLIEINILSPEGCLVYKALGYTMLAMRDRIHGLVLEMQNLIGAALKRQLSYRADSSHHG